MTTETKSNTGKGALLAVGAAALILAGCASNSTSNTASSEAKVHCAGLNSCKGTSDCKTAENACAGKNVCKGHGFLSMTKADCDAKGGKVI